MKFLPTSSLDRIEAPAPFVPATQWAQFRSQFRSSRSQRSGYRNCTQAADVLNRDALEWDANSLDTKSTSNPFVIALQSDSQVLDIAAVDACFGDSYVQSICESIAMHRENVLATSDEVAEEFELELGLLESVQAIAMSLAKTAPVRVVASNP